MTQDQANLSIISIDELQSQGINASDIQKLKAVGICSVTVSYDNPDLHIIKTPNKIIII